MNGKLFVIDGPEKGRSFDLPTGQPMSIGRGQASDTKINDPHMSRVHCRIEFRDSKPVLVDAGSTGGTYFHSEKITEQPLRNGDVFQVGDTKIRFTIDASQEETTLGASPANPQKTPRMKDLIGEKLADFELEEIIAAGRSGVIFQGKHATKGIKVAVKVLTPDMASGEEQKERFIRAMKTMLPIQHPNIIRLYNAGKKGPFCWAAMEFVEGESLTKIIEKIGVQGMLDWREVFRVAVQIGRALQEAHEHKIIHRNLTPANIMRRTEDKVCLLGDLMLAKGLEGALARQVTQPGQLIGDLPYMSPERTQPDADPDQRSDLYGLGATLYAMLTGRPPVEGDSMPVIVTNVRNTVPQPPKSFQFSTNEKFSDVVMQLLEKRPEDRYQTPSAMLEDLERIRMFNGLPDV